jgi:tRNA pseudouridine38-40 synthase
MGGAGLPSARHLLVLVRARSFLYHQVRNMVAALAAVGMGRLPPSAIATLLQLRDRGRAPPTAPAAGLFLAHVDYGPSYGRGTIPHLLDAS